MLKNFNLSCVHPSWLAMVQSALDTVNPAYLRTLQTTDGWLPGPDKLFNAFSLPFEQTRIILLGESPYPRPLSANGYAFWDDAVASLWSESGLSKTVNRATSLRNFIKMLLLARGDVNAANLSQDAIAKLNKADYIDSAKALFENMMAHGILLLNASLVLSSDKVQVDASAWEPFLATILQEITQRKADITLLLLGKIAQKVQKMPAANPFPKIICEHPYNISFITNDEIIQFFKPLDLLNPLSVKKKSFRVS